MKKVIAVNVLVLVIGVIVIELVFGSWLKEHNYGFLTLPRDIQITSNTAHLYDGGGDITYSRDAHGLRGSYGEPKDIDLLVLGGSTANEMYIDDMATWPQLISKLAKADGVELDVANAGVDGQSSVGHIWNYEMWFPNIPDLAPKYTLAYVGINERKARGEDATNKGLPQHTDMKRRVKQYIRNNSAIFHMVKIIKGTLKAHRENLTHGRLEYTQADLQQMPVEDFNAQTCEQTIQKEYMDRLGELTKKIEASGSKAIFATQKRGDLFEENGIVFGVKKTDAFKHGLLLKCINETTLAFCRQQNVPCVDVAAHAGLNKEDFYDAAHTNPAGSRKVAAYMYSELKTVIRK